MKAFKQILYMCLIPLMLVTKVIEYPYAFNFSPADFLMLILGPLILIDFVKDVQWRKVIVKNHIVKVFFFLVIIRIFSSFASFFIDVEKLSIFGMIFANLKFLVSFAYFLAGLKVIEILGAKRFLVVSYLASYLFLVIGLLGIFVFRFEWVGLNRMVSLANDPNVAGMVCLFGAIFGVALFEINNNVYVKSALLISFLPFVFGIILTGSRTCFIVVIMLALFYLFEMRKMPKKALVLLSFSIILIVATLFVEVEILGSKHIDALVYRAYYDTERASDYRNVLSRVATEMGNDYWLSGVGTGQYPVNSEKYFRMFNEETGTTELVTHNTFLSFYAENGLLGFVLYFLILGLFIKNYKVRYARMYVLVVVVMSLFFNIENIRCVWFFLGSWMMLSSSINHYEKDLNFKWRHIVTAFLVIVLLSLNFSPRIVVPFVLKGQSLSVDVKDELEIYIEFRNTEQSVVQIDIVGPTSKKIRINNSSGYYYEKLKLSSGKYSINLEPFSDEIIINYMQIGSTNQFCVQQNILKPDKLCLQKPTQNVKLSLLKIGQTNFETNQPIVTVHDVYGDIVKGVNFGDDFVLISTNLEKKSEDTYQYSVRLLKKNYVDYEPILYFYGLKSSYNEANKIEDLAIDFPYDPSLSTLDLGDEVLISRELVTNGDSYLIGFEIFYWDKQTENKTYLTPGRLLHGFIK